MRRRLAIALLLSVGTGAARADYVDTPECRRDLGAMETNFAETLHRLDRARQAALGEKCAAYRHHVVVMQRASDVFARCATGQERGENIGQMIGSIEDVSLLIRERCMPH